MSTSIPITDLGYDSHVQCFLGWLGVQTDVNPIPRDGGPENSLNLWGDQNDFEWEILCDYGAAYTLMELLADRFGIGFMGDLHKTPSSRVSTASTRCWMRPGAASTPAGSSTSGPRRLRWTACWTTGRT